MGGGVAQQLHRRVERQQIELQRLDAKAPVIQPAGDQHMALAARHLIEERPHRDRRRLVVDVVDHQQPARIGLEPAHHRRHADVEIGRVLLFQFQHAAQFGQTICQVVGRFADQEEQRRVIVLPRITIFDRRAGLAHPAQPVHRGADDGGGGLAAEAFGELIEKLAAPLEQGTDASRQVAGLARDGPVERHDFSGEPVGVGELPPVEAHGGIEQERPPAGLRRRIVVRAGCVFGLAPRALEQEGLHTIMAREDHLPLGVGQPRELCSQRLGHHRPEFRRHGAFGRIGARIVADQRQHPVASLDVIVQLGERRAAVLREGRLHRDGQFPAAQPVGNRFARLLEFARHGGDEDSLGHQNERIPRFGVKSRAKCSLRSCTWPAGCQHARRTGSDDAWSP